MSRKVEKRSFPRIAEESLSIEVTSHCNIECAHCFARARVSRPSALAVDLAKEIIKEGYEISYRHLHITGGEPLLWKGLYELLELAFKLGYQTVLLNTNGTLLREEICKRLSAYDNLLISLSLEGTESLHEHLRGKDNYQTVVHGMQHALDSGMNLRIFTTACKSMLPELPDFAENLFKSFPGVKHLALIQLIKVADDSFTLSDELLEPQEFLQLVRMVSVLNLFGLKTYFLNNPLSCVASELLKIPWLPQPSPLYRDGSMIVMANRDISLSHSSRISFGKYRPGIIAAVRSSEAYQHVVTPDETTCPACQYSEVCKKNGMLHPSEIYWEVSSKKNFCQRVLNRIEQKIGSMIT